MKVIVPCCGRSSRFPNLPPKWMLPGFDGRPMICAAISGLAIHLEDLIVTILREHEDRFGVTAGLADVFGRPIATCILDQQTRSQSETVAATLRATRLKEPFLVKDSDGSFVLDAVAAEHNYVCVDSLNQHDLMNPRNKSYVRIDNDNVVTAIREKFVISEFFNVGGYYFRSPDEFLQYFDRLSTDADDSKRELYLSNVIAAMLVDKVPFQARLITRYRDWGTLFDWQRELGRLQTFFVALDGFVFERGSPSFRTKYDEVKPHAYVVEAIRTLIDVGHRIIFLSVRDERWKEITERQLAAAGLPSSPLVFNCPMSQWLLIGGPHDAGAFRSVESAEISPDDARAGELLHKLSRGEQ